MKSILTWSRVPATLCLLIAVNFVAAGLQPEGATASRARAWVGCRVIDGTGKPPLENATLVVRNGRVEAVGRRVRIPAGAERIDATGKTIIPGLINAHGHVNDAAQLGVYLRDGITTVLSLGGDKEFALREQNSKASPGTAPHLYVAGPIQDSSTIPGAIAVRTPEEARKSAGELMRSRPDVVKLRVDDFLGARQKMSPEVYQAVIGEAHKNGLLAAAHIVTLDDAKGVLRAGADYIAHSVRDREADEELIRLMKRRRAFYSPTLTRELAVFGYGETPAFFRDPFFLKEADPEEIKRMQDPKRQETVLHDPGAAWYKQHMAVAMRNLKIVSDAGIPIVLGTDSGGGPGRFQGYFEHLELEYMTKAGLTPMQALLSATRNPAQLLRLSKEMGTLEKGKQADFLVLTANPLDDIRNTRKIESVWIGGVRVPEKGAQP